LTRNIDTVPQKQSVLKRHSSREEIVNSSSVIFGLIVGQVEELARDSAIKKPPAGGFFFLLSLDPRFYQRPHARVK